jgi:hypothetical protein
MQDFDKVTKEKSARHSTPASCNGTVPLERLKNCETKEFVPKTSIIPPGREVSDCHNLSDESD